MEMKLEEAQICRLCGECESIYIDVFGEEGTKRFLGVKIHTKINILIDETDPLPKAICVQCLGKLEFVCDFQEECLRTQQVLRERYNLPPLTDGISENDGLSHNICIKCLGTLEFLCDFHEQCHNTQKKLAIAKKAENSKEVVPEPSNPPPFEVDFDKENAAPIMRSNIKRKKSTNPETPKNEAVANNVESKRVKVNVQEPKKSQAEAKVNKNEKENMNTTKETKKNENEATKVNKNGENNTKKNNDKKIKDIEETNINNQEGIINKNVEAKMNKLVEKNLNKIEVSKETNNSNKTSSPSAKSNESKYSMKMETGLTTSPRENKKITDWLLNKFSRQEAPNSMDPKCDKTAKKISVINTKGTLSDNEPIEVIVKVENDENMSEAVIPKNKLLSKNKIVWIPNMIKLPDVSIPKSARMETLHGDSPPRGDEAETQSISCGDEKNLQKKKEGASMEVARKSVIEINDTRMEDGRSKRSDSKIETKKSSVVESEENAEEPTDESDESDESDEDGNVKTRKFGKIMDLITEEQKEAIEKFYTCNMSVVNEKIVGEHIIFLDRKKFGCKLCDASYVRQDKCQVHIWAHLDMKPYRCNACEFSTVTVSNIRCHVRKSHLKIKPYACEICEKRYVTSFLLEEHLHTHTGSRPYSCDVCEFTSASRQVLSYHKTTHKTVKDVTCNDCGKKFFSKSRLRAHSIIHKKDKAANMCKFCSIYLCNSEALQKHYANVHNKDYICDECGKICKSKKALNNHQNVHSPAKYKCTLCSNVYKSSHILKEHHLKHEGIRKYKCNVCQKDFAQQSHLAAHMAVHSDKRFLCPGCKRPFNRHDNMKMHTKRCGAFLANPELATLLSTRRSQSQSLKKNTEKVAPVETVVSSIEAVYTKTDIRMNEEREIVKDVPKTRDEYREEFTTIVVESTIPCT